MESTTAGFAESHVTSRSRRCPGLFEMAWVGLLVLAAFPMVAPALDLASVFQAGIPADHRAAFRTLTGLSVGAARAASPGLVHHVGLLEIGYATPEIVFGVLFLAIVAFPFRRGERWAWAACWAVLAADVAYSATFGAYSTTILRQSLVADMALPVLLILSAPGVFRPGHRAAAHEAPQGPEPF